MASSKKTGAVMAKIGTVLLAASIAPALGFQASVNQSVKMEDAMSNIARVVSTTDSQLLSFENTLEKMSEQLGKSKVGLAQMAFEGGKLGTKLKDMEPFLLMVSKTAIAFDLQDEEAGRAIGSIRAKMGLMNKDTQTLLDSVNFLADTTSASGARMINVIERVSGTMSLLKIPPKAVAALAGFSDQLEVSSELAASGLNMFISRMKRFPGLTTKLMNKPLETIRSTLVAIAKMGPEVQGTFIRKAFGDEAGRFVQKMVANVELFDKTVTSALSADAAGSMQRELESQLKRSSKTFERFSQTATNSLDSIGDAVKPLIVSVAKFLTPLIDGIGRIAKENPKIVRLAFVFTVATVAVGLLTLAAGGLAIAIGFITAPFLLVSAAIGLLISAGFLLIENWEDMKGGARLLWQDVSGFFSNLWGDITDGVENLANTITDFFTGVILSASGFGSNLLDILISPITFAIDKISNLKDKMSSLFSSGSGNKAIIEIKAVSNISKIAPKINEALKLDNITPKINRISNIGKEVAPLFNFNETGFEARQSSMQKSQTDINVNLRAPSGVIESVKSKTTGSRSGLNMGVNMQATG